MKNEPIVIIALCVRPGFFSIFMYTYISIKGTMTDRARKRVKETRKKEE